MPDNDLQAGLDSFLAKESEFKATTLRNNWANSAGTSPDDFAKQISLSRATGIPPQSLFADPEEAKRHEVLQGTDFTGLVDTSPKTTNFLLDPKNAGLYRDKVPELSALEGVLTSFKRGLTSGLRASDASTILESVEILDAVAALEGGDKSVLTGKYGSLFAGVGGSPEALKRRRAEAEASYRENLVEYTRRTGDIKKLPMTPEFEAFSRSEGVRDTLGTFANAPFAVTAQLMAQSTGQLLPVMPLMIGGGLVGGVRGLMGGTGGGSFLTGFQADISGELDKRKIDLGDTEAISALSTDPEFKRTVQRAFVKNAIIGGFDAATAGIAGGVRLAKGTGRNLAAQTGVQMAGGAGGEVAGSALSGQEVSFNAAFSEAIAEIPGGAFDASIIAAGRYIGTEAQAGEAQINAAKMQEMFATLQDPAFFARDPDTLKAFFQALAPDASVLIDSAKLTEVLTEAGIDVSVLPSAAAQLATGEIAGPGIEIPVGELLTGLAGTGAEAALIPHIRFGADAPTLAETREAGTKASEFFQKEAERIIEEQSRNEDFVAGAKTVQDDIKAQLDALGRFGPQATSSYATLTGAFYTTMASQLGITPLQLRDGWTDAQGVARKGYKLNIGGTQNAARGFDQLEKASKATFTQAGVANLLKTDDWTILTAENPNAQKLSDEENAARNAELQQYLAAQGFDATPVKGHYGQPENSFVVTGVSPEQALALAKKFEQESVLTRHGLIYQDGSVTPSTDVTVHPTEPEDFYTTLPDGTHFTVGLDFEGPRTQLSDVLNQRARTAEEVKGEMWSLLAKLAETSPEKRAALNTRLGQLQTERNALLNAAYGGPVLHQISPEQALQTNVPVELPTSQEFIDAVAGTPGAKITKDGLLIDLVRYQKQAQEGAQAIRTGVFYLPTGATTAKHYKKKGTLASGNEYGRAEEFKGETLVRRPLFVKGATGGKAPEAAYDILKGKKAYEAMRGDVLRAISGFGADTAQKIENVREMLTRYGAEPGLAAEIVRNSRRGNLLPYAVQENIVAHAVRAAGYDAVIGYSTGKTGLRVSEVFDVREQTFPARGMESDIHDAYLHQTARDFQTVTPAQVEAIRKTVAWTEAGTENGFPTWKNGQIALAKPVDVTEGHDVFYKPLGNERAVKYEIQDANGRSVGYTVLELADGWPTMLLDIEVANDQRGKRYAEQTVAAITNDVGELGIWHIVPSARSWWERIGAAPVDEHNGTIDFNGYADARASRENAQGLGKLYQENTAAKPGAVAGPVVGIHFSREKRGVLTSSAFGTGLQGAERTRLAEPNDPRIKQRIAFYVSNGKGIHPEAGVGGAAHVATLTNLYDADADALKLYRNRAGATNNEKANAFESSVIDAGFDGYLQRDNFTNEGTAVLLGDRSVIAPHVGGLTEANAMAAVPPPAEIPALKAAAITLANDRTLPGGALTATKWKEKITAKHPDTAAQIDFSKFDPAKSYYIDEITGALWQQATDLYAAKNGDKLGSFNPNTLDLRLLADANLSTFLHETGHFFLTVYADLASQPDAPEAITKGMAEILKQFGIADVATWQAMPLELQRPYHEQFAESFEQYLFTGKAPSLELQPLFQRFASWLTKVYASIKEFIAGHDGAKLNPELAAVFDNMLAPESEIAAANAARGFVALFKDAAEAGMSDKDFAAYTALSSDQRADAEEMLRTRGLRDMKWLQNRRNKIIAELQADAKEQRAAVFKEVKAEVAATPIRMAERYLKHGKLLNPEGMDIAPLGIHKLQISEVAAMFPEEALTPAPDWRKALKYGQYGMLAEIGLTPDEVAERVGIATGDELVSQLIGLTKFTDEVEALTDQRMLEQYGDLSSPEAISRAADEAIHNDARTRMVATELSALAKNIGAPSVLMKAAKEYARQIIETKSSKTLKPWGFAAAESRAGKAALEALRKGDREKAAAEKRTELVNHVSAKEAYLAEKEIKKIIDRFKKLAAYNDESSAVKSRDFATVNALRAVLFDVGIGSERKGLKAKDYLETVTEHDPATGARLAELIDGMVAGPWEKIPLAQLRDLSDSVKDIWALASRTRSFEIEGKLVALEAIDEELYAVLEDKGIPLRVPGEGHAVTDAEKIGLLFETVKSVTRRMEQWADGLDGNRVAGPFSKYIIGVIKDAESNYLIARAGALDTYGKLLDAIRPSLAPRLINAPELGYVFGKGTGGSGVAELLHAILHTGNDSNKRKLLLGRGWADLRDDGSMDTSKWDTFVERMHNEGVLTKTHYDFAQGVWDLLESMKPAAQAAHRSVFGRFFSEITANPVTTPFGEYRGGYVPALTDTDIVKDAEKRKLQEQETDAMNLAFPTPSKGFAQSRVENYNRELLLDLRSLAGHINKVLLFSHMTVPINDVRRVLGRPRISSAINRIFPKAINSMITPWLNRAAKHQTSLSSPEFGGAGSFWSQARANAGMSRMMANASNTLQQVTGVLSASLKMEKPSYLMKALGRGLFSHSENVEFVTSRSKYMRVRIENEVSAASHNIHEILLNPSVYDSAKNWTARHAYFLQSAVDAYLSSIIWTAGYNEVKDRVPDISENDAVHVADELIRQTQGATGPTDLATYEAGHPFFQLFTQFAGWSNTQAQLLGNAWSKNLARDVGMPQKFARAFFIVGIGFYAQAIVAELIAQLFRGGPDDDDKDGQLIDDWAQQILVMGPVKFATGLALLPGRAVMATINAMNSKPYDDKINTAPAISALEAGLKLPKDLYSAVFDGGKPSKPIKDVAELIGLFTGLPAAALARPVGYLADVAAGAVAPTGPLDAVRGTITGVASPESKK